MDPFQQNNSLEEQTANKKQLSIKEILAIVKVYGIEVLKYSWLMLIVGAALGYYMRGRKLKTPTTYTAYASFKMDEESSATQQNIASLFGAGGGAGSSNKTTLKSLKELINTRMIIHQTLFQKTSLKYEKNAKKDFLINHYLRLFSYKKNTTDNFYFTNNTIDPYSRKENRLIKAIHSNIANNFILTDITPTGTVNIECFSTNEDFSYELISALYHQLDTFYSKKKLKQKETFYEMAQSRTDDLRAKLAGAEKTYIKHMNTSSAEASGRYDTAIKTQYLSTNLRSATEAYFGALRSQEAAWIAYEKQKQSAVLQMIDQPLYPLRANVPNPFLHMMLGFVGGFILVLLLVVARKFFKDYIIEKNKIEKDKKIKSEILESV